MASNDLVFSGAPLLTGDLVFGDDGSNPISDAVINGTIAIEMPALAGQVVLGIVAAGAIAIDMPALLGEVIYNSDTQRPLVGQVAVRWQDADARLGETEQRWQDTAAQPVDMRARFQDARMMEKGVRLHWRDADRQARVSRWARYQDARRTASAVGQTYSEAIRVANKTVQRFEQGVPSSHGLSQRFQDGVRGIAGTHSTRFQDALQLRRAWLSIVGSGQAVHRGWRTRYQDGIQPTPGVSQIGPHPPEPQDPCYVPSGDLVFDALWSADTNLVFVCEAHVVPPGETVVVPVRRIYTVINTATLIRVDGDVLIPTVGMTLSIDVESWTWSFSARVPGAALEDLQPVDGVPVEVEARINGLAYRAIVEGITRERVFGSSNLSITGRGKPAILDRDVVNFGNASDQTIQQLANSVLTLNGVSLGWDIDAGWQPDNWLVPAGAWAFQGTRMAALNAIAAAAGAYVQPHPTAKALSVLRRYPAMPRDWGDVTPDYELPSAVVQKEGVQWVDKPFYNRVFVRGMKSGVLGQATLLGSAGEWEAPMVTDALITSLIGARQRAIPVLADVGRQAAVSLRLPVLAETGLITPGKFVRYVDGGVTRLGLVRSTSAEVQRDNKALTIWQTIGVETHVDL